MKGWQAAILATPIFMTFFSAFHEVFSHVTL
ncbi:hypothetical protein H4W34_005711 [Actinomadura algeriensis]|uniref:MFS transporter n=1 Tax=Actinomadura algeriensis TaxID=1679523 RepID=A0ABR9JZR8_9ACTN|nr:hypothetical protein [Actinomadura algeriensis]